MECDCIAPVGHWCLKNAIRKLFLLGTCMRQGESLAIYLAHWAMHCLTKIDEEVNFDIGSLWFSDVILWHISGSTLPQITSCFQIVPNILRNILRDTIQYLGALNILLFHYAQRGSLVTWWTGSTTVLILPCFVQNFETIGQLKWISCVKETLQILSLRWDSDL